jgi:putative hydrolase of the HAD superfamily
VDERIFYERWSEDEAYRAHETGELSFTEYTAALTETLGVSMSHTEWHKGWNEVFVGPYPGVQAKLKALSGRLPLFAFTNTNPTHEVEWHARYSHALDRFVEIYVSSTIGLRKPDQQAFEWVTAAMQLAAGGDSLSRRQPGKHRRCPARRPHHGADAG